MIIYDLYMIYICCAAFVAKLSLSHVHSKCLQFRLTCSGHMTTPGRRGRPTFSLLLSSQLSGKPLLCTTEVVRMILCFLTSSRISRPTLSETELHSNRRQKRSQTREQTTWRCRFLFPQLSRTHPYCTIEVVHMTRYFLRYPPVWLTLSADTIRCSVHKQRDWQRTLLQRAQLTKHTAQLTEWRWPNWYTHLHSPCSYADHSRK